MSTVAYGHEIPPFEDVLAKVFGEGLRIMSVEQVRGIASALTENDGAALSAFLGPERFASALDGLSKDKRTLVVKSVPQTAAPPPSHIMPSLARGLAHINTTLELDQLKAVLATMSSEETASQSLYLGVDGRALMFSLMDRTAVQAILDHTEDWVLLETGKRALESIQFYAAQFHKREKVSGKLQPEEHISLKVRVHPLSMYMKWNPGAYKGRELLYNEAVLGVDMIRVREGGMLGLMPVTLSIHSPVSRRGTNHPVTDVGLHALFGLVERDYVEAGPRNHLRRVNHGIVELGGRSVYKLESILPRDPSLGYYCYRTVHYTDFARALEVKVEIYDFRDKLIESYEYTDIDLEPGFSDNDFDPKNRTYRLA